MPCYLSVKSSVFGMLIFLAFAGKTTAQTTPSRSYQIGNNCPVPLRLYINANYDSTLHVGAKIVRDLGPNVGGIAATTQNGTDILGTTVRFFGNSDPNAGLYYVVKNPEQFNVGVFVGPNYSSENGFCDDIRCENFNCTDAFSTTQSNLSDQTTTPALRPLHSCVKPNLSFSVTFCPSGRLPIPAPPTVAIHPAANKSKCLDVRGNVQANGTPVQIYDCNGTGAQKWTLGDGPTKVKLAGTNFCLDATSSNPSSGTGMKIWTCYDDLVAQQWNKLPSGALTLIGSGQCLDLTNGDLTNSNQVQTWQCSNGNQNQVWTTEA
ncbi:hypothetical protein JR316_0009813 [Psilocybe cubensis]|uniref:Uncharacterized protein n=2 Tax=Psilocybe cubensis TaxID=181762 RepID=A0ACB8GPK7_PSICU|nr:hypothetical protein JR316_0009813 [Psilocybe cubensis]KAH9477591.1 hypothetical protein JR316_0009813 [Psilocybe cubensis]